MLTILDVMAGKLTVQMGLSSAPRIRGVLKDVVKDLDSTQDLLNRLHREGVMNADQVRTVRSFVALYKHVRSESIYVRIVEKKKIVEREILMRLIALLEAEWYRRRLGDVLIDLGQISEEEDNKVVRRVMRQVKKQDDQILDRYLSENFKGVGRPLVPGRSVKVESFRLSAVFRSKTTRTLVRKHLLKHRNVAESLEKEITRETRSFKSDFDDVWALPDDMVLDSGPDITGVNEDDSKVDDDSSPDSVLGDRQPPTLTPQNFQSALDDFDSILMAPVVRTGGFDSFFNQGPADVPETKASRIGPYEIVEGPRYGALGQALYRVKQDDGPIHTLQSIDPRVAPPEELERFQRQIRALSAIKNDYCLRIMGKGSTKQGQHYMVLPVLNGQTLAERIKERGNFDMVEAFDLGERMLEALDAIHKAGYVVRDYQPKNLLLLDGKHATPILTDLRLVTASENSQEDARVLYKTKADDQIGNPAYMAPESSTGDPMDGRTDLYSFGIVFFEMLSGHLPLRANSPQEYLTQHLIGQPYALSEVRPEVRWDSTLEAFIARLLAKGRKERFENAEHALRALKELREPALTAAAQAPATVRHSRKELVSGVFNEYYNMSFDSL